MLNHILVPPQPFNGAIELVEHVVQMEKINISSTFEKLSFNFKQI